MAAAFYTHTHARNRFAQRVDACDDPHIGLLRMWNFGCDATDEDLKLYRCDRRAGSQYRIGIASNGLRFLVIMRNRMIRTVLEPR